MEGAPQSFVLPSGSPGMLEPSSPIMPASCLCAFLCCLCGFLAFLFLQVREQRGKSSGQQTFWRGNGPLKDAANLGGESCVPAGQAQLLPPLRVHSKFVTPAPDTPTASPQAPIKLLPDSEDGNSSSLLERISSGHFPEGLLVDPPPAPVRMLYLSPADRGPLVADISDGEHNYVWDDGSEYFGEWRDGCAQGRGVFSWPSGDRYEGEWEQGRENGVGTYIFGDGSTFYGFWTDGRMHGEGVYKPAAADNQRAEVMFMREYNQGRLVKETVLCVKDYDLHRKELKRDHRARKVEKKEAAKELATTKPGETIYKGHRSYNLMRNLQIGILFSIAKTNREVSERDSEPLPADYKTEVTQQFPRSGQSSSFKWKDYCPLIFHRLRQAFGIDNRDYLLSLTGDKALRELPSPGKSGSVFFISDDDRFMIKTVRKEEMRLLLELVPKYYSHCLDKPDTLLTRFYGVHRVKPINGHHVRFLVMGNVFPTEAKLHRKYDLKGSTHGRTAGIKRNDPNATLKDLDVDFRLQLKETYYNQLIHQIEADAALLERMHVIDYSLLLGVHYVDWEDKWYPPAAENTKKEGSTCESPLASDLQQMLWNEEHAVAERGAERFSPEKTLFNRWRSKRQILLDEPTPPVTYSESTSREEQGNRRLGSPLTNSEREPPSPASSLTSLSIASTSGRASTYKKVGSVEDLRAHMRNSADTKDLSGSWPAASPLRPTRFALQSRAQASAQEARSSSAGSRVPATAGQTQVASPVAAAVRENDDGSDCSPSKPPRDIGFADSTSREASGLQAEGMGSVGGAEPDTPILRLLNHVEARGKSVPDSKLWANGDEQPSLDRNPLNRTRSGWLKESNKGTSLRSLHRRHMGVSIPALAFPRRQDGTIDVEAKPQPVTLFFGIIDFLQDYNIRKRTEHVLKSIVQDGRTISVTSPHAYSQRFINFMHTLFIAVSD